MRHAAHAAEREIVLAKYRDVIYVFARVDLDDITIDGCGLSRTDGRKGPCRPDLELV
jgi:hypothetical protein